MNPEAQHTALLTALGWTFSHDGVGRKFWTMPNNGRATSDLPSFLGSLDDAVAALVALSHTEDWCWSEYEIAVNTVLKRNHWDGLPAIFTMTAVQITEAILRALRLWTFEGMRVEITSGAWKGDKGRVTGPKNEVGATPIALDTGIALAWYDYEFKVDE